MSSFKAKSQLRSNNIQLQTDLPYLNSPNNKRILSLQNTRTTPSKQWMSKEISPYTQSNFGLKTAYNFSATPRLTPIAQRKFIKWTNFFTSDNSESKVEETPVGKEVINNSQEWIQEDSEKKETIGNQAGMNYYNHYRKLQKIQDQNRFSKVQDSAFTCLLANSISLNILPSKVGLIRSKGSESIISIKHQKFGDNYIKMLSSAIKLLPIEKAQLQDNRITDKSAINILSSLHQNTKIIDLSNNKIGPLGCQYLSEFLEHKDNKLQVLNLEDNKLGSKPCVLLIQALLKQNHLRILNLSKNFLSDSIMNTLAQYIKQTVSLQELYLHWNQLYSTAGNLLFDAISQNSTIHVLDVSWNSLGLGSPNCILNLCALIKTNQVLIHVDLSNNSFDALQSTQLSEALNENHTIMGFHFDGNFGYVDPLGYLIVNNEYATANKSHVEVERINGIEPNGNANSTCWICSGWNEYTFTYNPLQLYGEQGSGISSPLTPYKSQQVFFTRNLDPVYIHFDFEDWVPRFLGKKKGKQKIQHIKMVPPTKIQFVFTVGTHQFSMSNYDVINRETLNKKKIKFSTMTRVINLDFLNQVTVKSKQQIIDKYYVPIINAKPRAQLIYVPPKEKAQKEEWQFKNSIFKDWRRDDEELLTRCFEEDWKNTRIARVIKNEDDLALTKEILRKVYKQYKECYKYYASINPTGEIWSIQQGIFLEWVHDCQIVDNKLITDADVDIKFTATVSAPEFKGNFRNPERGIIRHQLMEAVVRLAENKYFKKVKQTMSEAVELILKDSFYPVFEKYNQQEWRDTRCIILLQFNKMLRYWNQECDEIYKFYKSMLDHVFMKYSVKKKKPGQKNFMCLEELYEICRKAELFDLNIVERDVFMAFNLSMMTQWDELQNDRIFQMSFVEYLEAVARIAEKCSPALPYDKEEYTPEQRAVMPLHFKLEAICVILWRNIADFEFKQTFSLPKESIFASKEEDDKSSDNEY